MILDKPGRDIDTKIEDINADVDCIPTNSKDHQDTLVSNVSKSIENKIGILKKKKRGSYAPYEPKLRAEIAQFSMNHTNQVYFKIRHKFNK